MLLEDGLIELKDKKYHLVNPFLEKIDKAFIYRLITFSFEMTSIYPISYHGEQVYEGIWDYISMNEPIQCEESPLIVHGSNFLRILDEHKVMLLQKAIQEQRYISHLYLTSDKPRIVKKNEINAMEKKLFLPIKLVYDHIYGRWYVIGRDNMKKALKENVNFTVRKVDLISDMEFLRQKPDEEVITFYNEKIEKKLAQSWLVSQSNKVHQVKLKFSIIEPKIEQRLQREKRWGIIEKLDETSVLYSITVRDYHEMRPWIRSFSNHVQVLQPASLIKDIKIELEARLARYSDV